ncbi:MAG: 2,3-bisphosphoglycerate-independent phosphoglycerate mutase, partial [Candidatus Freyarchaeota archaeon]
GLSRMVSDSDPKKTGKPVLKVEPLEKTAEATKTAKILNELTKRFHEVLKNHPVNKERAKKGLPPANINNKTR